MASSFVQIANTALIRIGTNTIISFNDNTTESNIALLRWQDCRDAVLQAYDWSCATQRVVLAPLATAPAFGYDYAYLRPADCLKIINLEPDDYPSYGSYTPYTCTTSANDYRVENNMILSNESSINLKYIYRIQDATIIDSLCADAMAWYMASDWASILSQDNDLSARADRAYKNVLAQARNADSRQQTSDVMQLNFFERARLGGP